MRVSENDIEGATSLSNSLFIEEDIRSRPHLNNLKEGEDMPNITSVQETFVTYSPEVEIPASNTSVRKDGNLFNPPTTTTDRDNNAHLPTKNDNTLPVVIQTKDNTSTQPVDNDSDSEDIPIASDIKGSEHDDIAQQLNIAMDITYDYLATEIKVTTGYR